jgi:hypothetical protein
VCGAVAISADEKKTKKRQKIGRNRNTFLEQLIGSVWKSKKPMDDQNAGASDGRQEERKKRTHGETLRRAL